MQKPLTLIVSDLHMGDGSSSDDFVDDKNQFAKFLAEQLLTDRGKKGEIELIINGDFLEFVMVRPDLYTLNSRDYWCSRDESVEKLKTLLKGHPKVFKAIADFQVPGNVVTIFAGNHDIDLYWPEVRDLLRTKTGNVNIELKADTYYRYGNRLHISHGHLFPTIDTVNGFSKWADPILPLPADSDPKRLQMCDGTLFVVRLVNPLTAKYPFANNLHPETEILRVLLREDAWGLRTVAWLGSRFIAQHPGAALSATGTAASGAELLNAIQLDSFFREKIAGLCRDLLKIPDMTADKVLQKYATEDDVAELLAALLEADGTMSKWIDVIEIAKPGTSSVGSAGGEVLGIIETGRIDVRAACATIARGKWLAGAEIVVLGHTHLPEEIEENGRKYYNPGSWTRYIDNPAGLKLADLMDETKYPYKLKCVRIEEIDGKLTSEMILIDRKP
ncbi:UDP-2,3-diacylglucosamine pyrophosphatase LpxH [Bradyrhizobium sp. AZCC 2262]|uniref:hypothetical protein n=1 Tax=Bradyrhizobium sp. AZCC 2262 TaxID=3117022 RepID=UPI002FEFD0AB